MSLTDHEQPRVLVVDDSELVHRLLRVRLQHERLELVTAFDPEEALQMARTSPPDVILLDLDLGQGRIDGFAVLSELKSDQVTREVPVIVISASTELMDRVRSLDLGAIDFISKPFEVPELKARLRSAMRIRSLVRMLAQKARIDGLTGLWNRAYFDARLTQEVAEARRHDRPLSLVMCDLDRFKSLNDSYGHSFGDRVLERWASILNSGRSGDVACRYGGEEFALILPDTDAEQAYVVVDRMRELLEAERWSEHEELRVTVSMGIADVSTISRGSDPSALVELADAALYQAKSEGRNRVAWSREDPRPNVAA